MTKASYLEPHNLVKRIGQITFLVSSIVMYGWINKHLLLLELRPSAPTMKFNTALCFFLGALYLVIAKRQWLILKILIISSIFLISGLTLIQYIIDSPIGVDHLFIQDNISKKSPGRMSPATALSFMLISISAAFIETDKKTLHKVSSIILTATAFLALTSIIGYILMIPSEEKSNFFSTMAIHTSVLFILLSTGLAFMVADYGLLGKMKFKDYYGTKLLKSILPYQFILPILLSFGTLYLIKNQEISIGLGLSIYTVVFCAISLAYTSWVAQKLNNHYQFKVNIETALKASVNELEQFKYALDQSSLIDVSDKNGVITYANDKFCQTSGFNREEIIGRTHESLRSGYHTEEFYEKMWDTISAGKIWVGGIKNKTKDGKFYWVHTSIIPFRNEQNEVFKYLAIRQDITNFKILAKQHDNLVKRNKEVEQFSYIASHDLQEPLNSIESIIEIIEDENKGTLSKDTREYFHYMKSATSRMSQLINGLLVYSRLGRNRTISHVNCENLIDEVKVDLLYAINESKASITFDELPEVHAYKLELRQLFQNLIGNAIKFRKEDVPPVIKISAKRKDENWLFSISDNGIGISDDQQQEAFALFRQLHNRDEYEGTGIGLAHCEKIVQLHGGEIWVTSELGKGSTFFFTIPAFLH